jgi:hypothetical protein
VHAYELISYLLFICYSNLLESKIGIGFSILTPSDKSRMTMTIENDNERISRRKGVRFRETVVSSSSLGLGFGLGLVFVDFRYRSKLRSESLEFRKQNANN